MGKLRKCKGTYNIYENGHWVNKEFELGYFHQWGSSYTEFEEGPGNYTTAVVELPDGKVITPNADDITFLEPERRTTIEEVKLWYVENVYALAKDKDAANQNLARFLDICSAYESDQSAP